MTKPLVAPYGAWESPVTASVVASQSVRLGEVRLDGEDTYWLEMRPTEGGRSIVVRRDPAGSLTDVSPITHNVRTRVHEYGGGSYLEHAHTVYYSNFSDQRLYRQETDVAPFPITPAGELRFADAVMDSIRDRIICVREDHSNPTIGPINAIVSLDPTGMHIDQGGRILAIGDDFYSSPRVSPDGGRLAWVAWNHPNMPWDGSELWVSTLDEDGRALDRELVTGGPSESVFQPEWSPDGELYYVSDRNGWWNLYRWRKGQSEAVLEMEAEFGRPQWVFGMTTYAFASAERIICTYTQAGEWHLAGLDLQTGALVEIPIPYTEIGDLRGNENRLVITAGGPQAAPAIVEVDLETGETEILRDSASIQIDPGYLSTPVAVEFLTEGGLTAHGLYYEPSNKDYTGPADARPPLIVISHGGPTGATSSTLSPATQFWTSRGIAVLDVNYGGSTGYGRPYRDRLKGQWGIVDVDDCANGARYLVEQGTVDPERLIIRGGSAGGYTTLSALTFRDVFRAGASYYGVSDLTALAKETHKFESRYLDQMVGPYPEREDVYLARSPIHFVERITRPVIFFQGLEDRVVPPNQAELMVQALKRQGIPVSYVPFEGEQHGFRQATNIIRSLEAELYFYSRVFGIVLAQPVEPVEIYNLSDLG